MMRLKHKPLVVWSSTLLACVSASAINPGTSSNRYDEIPARNVFGLRPAPQQPSDTPPPPPLARVILKGISTIISQKKALLSVIPEQQAKPGQPIKEESYILGEHQREGGIEVVKIDEQAGIVKIQNSGTPMTITFEQENSRPPAPAQPPGPRIGVVPSAPRTLPSRFPRTPLTSSAGQVPPMPQTSPANIPTPTGFTNQAPGAPAAPLAGPTAEQVTPEEQAFLLQLQKEVEQENNQTPKPPPATTSTPTPPKNYLPRKVPLMPQ